MHLPFIQAPVRPEAPEGLSPSATSAKSPGSTAAFFATCMDHALAHSQAPQGRAGETEKPRPKPFALTHPAKAGQTGDTSAKEGRGVKPLVAPPAVWTHTGRPLHEPTAARNPATLPPTVVPHLAPETGSVPAQPPRPTAQPQGESPQAAPEKEDSDGTEGDGGANFAQPSPSSPAPPTLLEAIAIQLLASAPSPAPEPPPAPSVNSQIGNAPEAVNLTAGVAPELAQGVQHGLPVPVGSPASVPTPSPAQALQMLQPMPDAAPNNVSGSPAAIAQESQPGSRSLQAAPAKDSSPAQPALEDASLSTTPLPVIPAELSTQAAPAASHSSIASRPLHVQAPVSAAAAVPSAPAVAVGTAAAQQQESMQKTEQMLKSADLAQQKLPGEVVLPEGRQELTGSAERLASAVFSTVPVAGAVATVSSSTSASAPLVETEARLHSLERTQELVALHALRLRESGADSLRVILEPGAGMSLSLELRWSEGKIEAQATMHRGDFAYLNQHWADLQQRLEPRGVHLASLESTGSSGSGSQQFSQPQGQFAPEDSGAGALADFAFGDSMTDSPAGRRSRSNPAHRGWETWA